MSLFQRGEVLFKQIVHFPNLFLKVLEFSEEHPHKVVNHMFVLLDSLCDQVKLRLQRRSHRGTTEVGVYLVVSMNKSDTKGTGNHCAVRSHRGKVSIYNRAYVHRDGGVCTDTVFLHQRNKLRLTEVVGRSGEALVERERDH